MTWTEVLATTDRDPRRVIRDAQTVLVGDRSVGRLVHVDRTRGIVVHAR